MSALTKTTTQLKDLTTLVKALKLMGWTDDEIEIHAKPVSLSTYHINSQAKAHVIIRKKTLQKLKGNSYNDIGFEKQKDGTIVVHAGDYSSQTGSHAGKMTGLWQERLARKYAQVTVVDELTAMGYYIDSITEDAEQINIVGNNPYN